VSLVQGLSWCLFIALGWLGVMGRLRLPGTGKNWPGVFKAKPARPIEQGPEITPLINKLH
jgi:hypothetical protein